MTEHNHNLELKAKVVFEDWGTISYKEAWEKQISEHSLMVDLKKIYRDDLSELKLHQVNKLVFCEHPHVYTLGKSGKADHLKLDEAGLSAVDAEYFKTNRGGTLPIMGLDKSLVISFLILIVLSRMSMFLLEILKKASSVY